MKGNCFLLLAITVGLFANSVCFSQLPNGISARNGSMTMNKHTWGLRLHEAQNDSDGVVDAPEQQTQDASDSTPAQSKGLFVLGVCGGIASGKSKACQILTTLLPTKDGDQALTSGSSQAFETGKISVVGHIDMDKVAHTIYAPGSPIIDELVNAFGNSIITPEKTIDRAALGSIVFSDKSKLSILESLIWPHLKEKLLNNLRELENSVKDSANTQEKESRAQIPSVAVVEAAMLLESGWDDLLDAVWVVRTPREIALERMMIHRKMDRSEAVKRLDSQASRRGMSAESLSEACDQNMVTAVIENDSDKLEDLTRQLQKAWDDPKCWRAGCCPHVIGPHREK